MVAAVLPDAGVTRSMSRLPVIGAWRDMPAESLPFMVITPVSRIPPLKAVDPEVSIPTLLEPWANGPFSSPSLFVSVAA